jgi:hypothetical protein
MVFLRKGPGLLFLRTGHPEQIVSYLSEVHGGEQKSFVDAITEAAEAETIIFITPPGITKTSVSDASTIVHSQFDPAYILSLLFQSNLHHEVENSHLGPGLILLRVVGEPEDVTGELQERMDARPLGLAAAIHDGEAEDTIILLTKASLGKALAYGDILHEPLLIRKPVHLLYWDLRSRGIHFITGSPDAKLWYEVRINIYDAADHYEEHYRRLMLVLSDLDVGLVLGETWTKDHALALFSVLAYQVRLFTLEKPETIKTILMALEYDDGGNRFVDMDLYYRNRKLNKNDKGVRPEKGSTRLDLRNRLLERLSERTIGELEEIEERLKK